MAGTLRSPNKKPQPTPKVTLASATGYRLTPHLVPKPLWGRSAARLLGRRTWKRIRLTVIEAAGQSCEVCGDKPSPYYDDPLICHEVWHYDDKRTVATLVSLRAQCGKCDNAVHMGQAMTFGAGDKALAQLKKVNGIELREAQTLYDDAKAVWGRRSRKSWRIRVSKPLLMKHPELRVVQDSIESD